MSKSELPKKDSMHIRKLFQQYRNYCHKIVRANLQEFPLSSDHIEIVEESLTELSVAVDEYFGIDLKLEYEDIKDFNKVSMLTYSEFMQKIDELVSMEED